MRAALPSRVIRLVALAMFVAGCAPTQGGTGPRPARNPREALRHSIDSLVLNPQFRGSHIGLLVVNPATGDTLYSRNAGKLFVPASNMKIITGASALALLGPDYRFQTTFASRGAVRDSVLDGDLIVVGRGDPTVSDRAQQGNAMTWMLRVADSLSARGIKRVSGRLVRGGNAFPDSIYGYGWEWDDLSGSSAAPIDELLYDEGMTKVTRSIAGRDTLVDVATDFPLAPICRHCPQRSASAVFPTPQLYRIAPSTSPHLASIRSSRFTLLRCGRFSNTWRSHLRIRSPRCCCERSASSVLGLAPQTADRLPSHATFWPGARS